MGKKLDFINTHFDYRVEANKNSAPVLKAIIDKRNAEDPRIVTGDFNCTTQDYAYRYLTQPQEKNRMLSDAQTLSENPHHGPSYTINMFKRDEKPQKIDFIFVNHKISVIRHAVLADHWDGNYPSDHMPVAADIMLNA